MKEIWKKTMSLTLSILMLLGSLPLAAFAQEGEADIQPEYYPVWVDGQQLTEDTDLVGLDYDPEQNILYLEDLSLNTLKLGQTMTMVLSGDNTVVAQDGQTALVAEEDVTIKGSGSLTVTSTGETAMAVAGRQQEESQWGLTVDGTVTLVVQSLTSPGGVTLGGGTHMSLDRSTPGETFAPVADGYIKIGDGDFTFGGEDWSADGSALLFVGESHLQWQQDQGGHYRNCADENCLLAEGLRLDAGEHHTTREANCKNAAYCEVCGEYGERNSLVHANGEAETVFNGVEHWQQYPCCGAEVADSRCSHVLTTQTTEEAVTARCEGCAYTRQVTLRKITGQSYTYDGTAKAVEAVNELDDTVLSILYYDGDGRELDGAPVAAGTYQARAIYQDATLKLDYTIDRKTLEDSMVTLSSTETVYGSEVQIPQLTVAEGIAYTASYARAGEEPAGPESIDWQQAGTVTITVTGTGNYTGTVTKTYTIRQAEPEADQFSFAPPASLTYDGKKKDASLSPAEGVSGMGDVTVTYDHDPIHVGTYRVYAQVAGIGNYQAQSVTAEDWCFTIQPTPQYTDVTQKTQTVGNGIGIFQSPAFAGVDGETVEGTCTYTVKGTQIAEATLKEKLDALADGETLAVGYTFTPKQGGDYTGEKSGTIQVTKVQLSFAMEDGTAITDTAIRKQGTITLGDGDILDLSHLTATARGTVDPDATHFTVKYTQDEGKTLLEEPGVGTYQYIVYYNNPDFGGIAVVNAEVFRGWVTVAKPLRGAVTLVKPTAKPLFEKQDGTEQPLLTEENKGSGYEFSLSKDGPYFATIPTGDKAKQYTIYYRESGNAGATERSMAVVIYPYLTATYGQTMADLKLPEGFHLYEIDSPASTFVGEPGQSSVNLYYGENILNSVKVPLTVEKKPITVSFAIADKNRFMAYQKGTSVKAGVTKVRNETDNCDLPEAEYTLSYDGDTGRGEAKVYLASAENGHYAFETQTKSYRIYDLKAAALNDTAKISDAVKQAGFPNAKALRGALEAKFPEGYPEARRKYTYFIMKQGESQYAYSAEDFPTDGVAMQIAYPEGTDWKDTYKVYGMYLVDCGEKKAGTIVELTKTADALKLGEYVCYEDGICLKMPTYMAVAIGAEAEKYTLKRTSSTLGTITFTVGDGTEELTTAKVRAGDSVTVSVTGIKDKYSVSTVEYYETALGYTNSDPKKASKNSDGTYSFDMPEYDTTIKVTIRKTTGNPKTGDGIGLWMATFFLSGTGVAGLLGRRKKKH